MNDKEFETFDWAETKEYKPKEVEENTEEQPEACEIGCDSCGS